MPDASTQLIAQKRVVIAEPGTVDLTGSAPPEAGPPDQPNLRAAEQSLFAEEFAEGEAQYRIGNFGAAAAIFARLCEQHPDNSNAHRLLGLCRLRLGHKEAALVALSHAKELAPGDPWADLHLGLGLHVAGRYAEAVDLFRACQPRLRDDPAPSLNLAAALLELGHHAEAGEAARDAVRRAPLLPQAHYMLGMAQAARGELDSAEAEFREALRLNEDLADAWVNLGLVCYRKNNMAGARFATVRALEIDPAHRAALANYAVFERLTGDAPKGEAVLQHTLVRDPNSLEARLNLASNLIHQEHFGEALRVLDAVPPPSEPRLNLHWRAQRVLALIQLGRRAEARQQLIALGEGPIDYAPLLQWRWLLLALGDRNIGLAQQHAVRMEETLRQGGETMLPEHRIIAHFDLAKFWSSLRHHDRAFPFWTEGHRLAGKFQPFSRARHQEFIDSTIVHFSEERLRFGPRSRNDDQTPVFIVGMPRSCTTLTEQIIAAHPDAFGAGERLALGEAYARLGGNQNAEAARFIAALGERDLKSAAEDYLASLRMVAPGKRRVIDKMPGNSSYLGLVGLMLPGARIIHCARDPRDVGLSIFTFRFHGYHPYAHDLGDLGWYIGRDHRLMAHWHSVLPNPMTTVHLSDWVNDFQGTLRRLLDFLDLPYDAACERFHEQDRRVWTVSSSQVRQPINNRGIGRWRSYEKHLQPLFAELEAAGIMPQADGAVAREIAIAAGAV